MADSKFLNLQDGFVAGQSDGLHDSCGDLDVAAATSSCPGCIPNINYVAPDWKSLTRDQPWFNERLCTYYITYDTTEVKTIPFSGSSETENEEYMASIFEKYRTDAAGSMLIGLEKLSSHKERLLLEPKLRSDKFYLDPNPSSYLKLLYSIDYDTMESLGIANVNEENEDDQEDTDSKEDEELGDVSATVTLTPTDLTRGIDRLQQALEVYNKNYKRTQALEGLTFIYKKKKCIFPLKQVTINVGRIRNAIVSFLNGKGFEFPTGIGLSRILSARDAQREVTQVVLAFKGNYRLQSVQVYFKGCSETPMVYKGKRLRPLKSQRALKSPTAMAYIAAYGEMMDDLEARQPMPWNEFLIKHTFPIIKAVKGWPQTDPSLLIDGFEFPIRCSALANFLNRQGIQLGQDLLDQDFNLRDSLEHAFARTTNRWGLIAYQEQQAELGTIYSPTQINRDYIKGLALVQASQRIQVNNDIWRICGREFDLGFIDEIREFLARVKEEGLKEMLLQAIRGIMGGLTLQQALPAILGAALAAMSIKAYGKLYNRMPSHKRLDIDAIVKRKIDEYNRETKAAQSGLFEHEGMEEMFRENQGSSWMSVTDITAVNALAAADTNGLEFFRPWELLEDLKSQGREMVAGSMQLPDVDADTMSKGFELNPSQQKVRTLAKKLTTSKGQNSVAEKAKDSAALMAFFIEATIDSYAGASIYDLLELLDGMPGSRLIAMFLRAQEFPSTPLLKGDFVDWMKDRQPLFRGGRNLRMPYLRNPAYYKAKLMDFTALLFEAAKLVIQKAIMVAMAKLIERVCQIISSGSLAEAMQQLQNIKQCTEGFKNNFEQIIDDGILRYAGITQRDRSQNLSNDDTLACTTLEMFQKFGAGASALSNPDTVFGFIEDLSCSLTRGEMMKTFLGDTTPETNRLIESLVDNEYPTLSGMFENAGSPGDFFKAMGDTFPPEFRDKMQDFVDRLDDVDEMPANPSLCASDADLRNFCDLRARLLAGRSSPEQSGQMCEDATQDALQALREVAAGMEDPMGQAMPTFMSDPGCDNGVLPFEPEETVTATGVLLSGEQDRIAIAFAEDMMSDRGDSPGFLNMILSDTMGNPLSKHYDLAGMKQDYVSFYIKGEGSDQYGQLPSTVAPWLRNQIQQLPANAIFNSNNSFGDDKIITKTYAQLGVSLFGGVQKVDLPRFGYKTTIRIDPEQQEVVFRRKARKNQADIKLSFSDNNNGLSDLLGTNPQYGFEIDAFFSEIEIEKTTATDASGVEQEITKSSNIYSDNVRIKVVDSDYAHSLRFPSSIKSMGAAGAVSWLAVQGAGPMGEPLRSRTYEFLSTESTLDNIDLANYPNFAQAFESRTSYTPAFVLFTEIIEQAGLDNQSRDQLKTVYDRAQQAIYDSVSNVVYNNAAAWLYGAQYDPLNEDMVSYCVNNGQTDSSGGTAYEDAKIDGEKLTNDDMVLGVSYDQYLNGDNARVLYLDPNQYGGTYMKPNLYIKPLKTQGWLGFLDVLFPTSTACTPTTTDVINFEDITKETTEAYKDVPDDDRVAIEECTVELPYNKILTRQGTVQAQGTIQSACRIFAAVNLIKSLATVTKFKPDFDNLYSPLYAHFVTENMERVLSSPARTSRIFKGLFTDNEFWFRFLELSVQTYGRLVDDGKIVDVPKHVLDALNYLNDRQEEYKYPSRKQFRALRRAGNPLAKSVVTLKAYREAKKINFIRSTETEAKIVLADMVRRELDYVGNLLTENLKSLDLEPDYENAANYFLTELCVSNLDSALNKPLQATARNLPTDAGTTHYTNGGEFIVPDSWPSLGISPGQDYVGYYHLHESPSGIVYMMGETHTDEPHPRLQPVSGEMIVPIGDLIDYEGANTVTTPDGDRPFILEKYISIDGVKYSTTEAHDIIMSNNKALNISDVYPGTLAIVYRTSAVEKGQSMLAAPASTEWLQEPIGLKGELGVRYGVQMSLYTEGSWAYTKPPIGNLEMTPPSDSIAKVPLVQVEMDVLDKSIEQFVPLEGDSYELLCMLNKLKKDEKFKLITEYIFPVKKHISIMAMYNNLGFVPSIGQITNNPLDPTSTPGVSVSVDSNYNVEYSDSDEWENLLTRTLNSTAGVTSLDEWDGEIYSRSRDAIKESMDRAYYSVGANFHSMMVNNFAPSLGSRGGPDTNLDKVSISQAARRALRNKLKPETAAEVTDVLTRSQKRRLTNNPFDAEGTLCDKSARK